jgi:hypothetical protein
MKIAILFSGAIREDVEMCRDAMKTMISNCTNHEVETFLFTNKNKLANSFIDMVDNILLLRELDKDYMDSLFTARCRWPANPSNTFRAFHRNKTCFEMVNRLPQKFDYVIYCRPDAKIIINDIDSYFSNDKYVVTNSSMQPIEDQFGVATPEIMARAWDYGDFATLNRLYGEANHSEDCLWRIMQMNGVSFDRADHQAFYIKNKPWGDKMFL